MQSKSIKIAITGGIGSGKTKVCELIKDKGFAVFSCDKIYGDLLKDGNFLNELSENFGSVILPDGNLDRRGLAEIVFNDNSALKKLNGITHSRIMNEAFSLMNGEKLSFLEVPLLFENGFEGLFDGVIVVLRDRQQRIESVIKRDNTDRKSVDLRINRQFNYDNYDFTKYYVIHNDENIDKLEQNVKETLNIITKKYFKKI